MDLGMAESLSHLKKNYANARSPVSFLSPSKIYKFYSGNLPMRKIKKYLSSSESYTLMKEEHTSRIFMPTLR